MQISCGVVTTVLTGLVASRSVWLVFGCLGVVIGIGKLSTKLSKILVLANQTELAH